MKRFTSILIATFAVALVAAIPAQAEFGISEFSNTFTNEDGSAATQAGSHPFAATNFIEVNTKIDPESGEEVPDDMVRTLRVALPAGFIGSRTAVPTCTTADFLAINIANNGSTYPSCPDSTAVGLTRVGVIKPDLVYSEPVYNLVPPPGVAAKIGFIVNGGIPVTVDVGVNGEPPNNLAAAAINILQATNLFSSELTLWGIPAAHSHDPFRGSCLGLGLEESLGTCDTGAAEVPFLTLPRSCDGPLVTGYEAVSWEEPNAKPASGSFEGPAMTGCSRLGFGPLITARPTSLAASSPSGLDFSLDVHDEGLGNPSGIAQADLRKAAVTLPEGMSINPSIAEGLEVCSEAELGREKAFSQPGAGCPNASKIGTVEVESPLVDEPLVGSLFQAAPYENPSASLVALYMVLKNANLGILIKQPLEVESDPRTGRITTVAENLPQLPFSHFRLHFREGTRSPLATPPGCGTYDATAVLTPSSGQAPVTTTSAFQVITGPNGGPCPAGGLPPFRPGLVAGTLNNAAGHFSPFNLRLSRTDSEQEITHFSIKLPPGITGKLAGIPFCSDAAIAAAKSRTGPHGGAEELASPSCPAASEVGRTLVGSGVGPALAYAPGKVYLAGPYHGSALSIAAITAAKVGPFDLGTVVVREALKINPETAEVFIDATGSDPIPHIIQGIPVHLRDIRAYVDRPDFVINPTGCEPTSTASTVLGSGLDFGSEADDQPVTVSTRFQAADCANLGFKPQLNLKLRGATKRGGNPALRATLIPRPGDANSKSISVALPHSEFLDQAHIRTVCTRVQFNAGAGNGAACPAGSIYGHARAWTPILSEPLEGPIFLRSSEHPLPDLVLAVHGLIDFNAIGRIDSVNGGIRNTFDFVPDAPISKVVVDFQGGEKGLLENSTDLCRAKKRAKVKFTGHNGKVLNANPVLQVKCKKGKAHKRRARAAR
ncbi:MAG TPA: hypothetical protein VHP56_06425 [Solirubrobacterales bacterium]|jgi:hypothetical protein|nr:hypothetical protein [Solirubrobacterales bacterium]